MAAPLSDSELLARLVAFDTTSRNSNLPLADFLSDYLEARGCRVERNPSADGTKANLIVWAGPEAGPEAAGRPGLVLSGHMDVVPAEEPEWESDPFVLRDGGDRWIGRGAADMKGFLAVASNLAAEAAEGSGPALRHPLALVFTYDEEVGTLGARRLLESYPLAAHLPRQAIIGEPTSLRVARAHKGHLKLRISLSGVSAHSGYPHLGVNAIEPMGRIVVALTGLRRELEGEAAPNRELFPEVPFVPLNVATVRGGSAINVVPDRCVVEIGLRPLPGMSSEELAARVRARVAEAALDFAESAEIEVLSDSPPMLLDDGAPLHRFLHALTGPAAGGSVSFATDAGWMQRLGMDCAVWGPGTIEVAHKPNEAIPKRELQAARPLLQRAIGHFCGEGE